MATSAKEWRKAREEGIEFTLPSGNIVPLRPVEVDFFIRSAHIPDALASTVTEYINGRMVSTEIPASEQVEQTREFLVFLNDLVKFAFVSPVVRDTPQEGEQPLGDNEISVDDVSYADKTFVFRYVFGRPAEMLRRFRDKINAVASVVPESDNGPAPVEDAEDQRVGQSNHRPAGYVDRITA